MKEETKKQEDKLQEDEEQYNKAQEDEQTTDESPEQEENEEQSNGDPEAELTQARNRIEELEDKNLRMMAEFDNYRRRTNKEKLDLMATAGERIFKDMLPLIDDFERALTAMDKVQGDDVQSTKEGVKLIYQKFMTFLDKNDVHAINTDGADFNTDEHEAVTTFAAGDDQKGKVIDCTQKGYKLGDKVIRFAKVVVGD